LLPLSVNTIYAQFSCSTCLVLDQACSPISTHWIILFKHFWCGYYIWAWRKRQCGRLVRLTMFINRTDYEEKKGTGYRAIFAVSKYYAYIHL
jgi:hypothetical protein